MTEDDLPVIKRSFLVNGTSIASSLLETATKWWLEIGYEYINEAGSSGRTVLRGEMLSVNSTPRMLCFLTKLTLAFEARRMDVNLSLELQTIVENGDSWKRISRNSKKRLRTSGTVR